MVLLLGGFWAIFELLFGVPWVGMIMNMGSLALVILLAYFLGATASLYARSQRVAFSSAFGIIVGLLFVFPILLLLLQSFSAISGDREFAESLISITNPAVYMGHVSGPLARGFRWEGGSWERDQERELWPRFMVYVALYGGMISLLGFWLIRRFDRAAGRT
jgi:hypothetical protein